MPPTLQEYQQRPSEPNVKHRNDIPGSAYNVKFATRPRTHKAITADTWRHVFRDHSRFSPTATTQERRTIPMIPADASAALQNRTFNDNLVQRDDTSPDTSLDPNPPITFKLRESLLLPPHLPIRTGFLDPLQHHEYSKGVHKAEIFVVVSAVLFCVLLGVVATTMRRRMLRNKDIEARTLPQGKGRGWLQIMSRGGSSTQETTRKEDCDERTVKPNYRRKTEVIRDSVHEGKAAFSSRIPRATGRGDSNSRLLPTIQEEPGDHEEVDITFIAFPNLPDNSSGLSDCRPLPSIVSHQKDSSFAELSLRAGVESAGKRGGGVKYRRTLDLDTDSAITPTCKIDWVQFEASFEEGSPKSEVSRACGSFIEDEDDEEEVFEVRRAQTKSMEVKKGILVSLVTSNSVAKKTNKHHLGSFPSFVIHNPRFPSISSLNSSQDGLLQTPLPDVVVTCPSISSLTTLQSSDSSVSVDLNDFPSPPSHPEPCVTCISTEIDKSPLFCEDDAKFNLWKSDEHTTSPERRSTVVQLIMMYGNT